MEEAYKSKLSPAMDYAAAAVLLLIAVLSYIGNSLVLITSFKRTSRLKPPELLTVNLALTDLGAAITMYPLSIASASSHRWLGGDVSCLYYGLMGFLFGTASIATLSVMSAVRFIVSLSLQSPKEKISRQKVQLLVALTWLYALLWAVLPLLGWGRYGPEPFGTSCTLAWGQMREQDVSFVICLFLMNLVAPATVIVVCYTGLALRLHTAYNSFHDTHHIPNVLKMHRSLMIIAVLVSVGFILSWTPYAVVSLWSTFGSSSSIPPAVALLPCLFAKSSTVYNPLIYYLFSKTFKQEVRELRWSCAGNAALSGHVRSEEPAEKADTCPVASVCRNAGDADQRHQSSRAGTH